jgi:hypothetical protein
MRRDGMMLSVLALILLGALQLGLLATAADAALSRMSAEDMRSVKGAAWCCNVTCASQHVICQNTACQRQDDPDYPCVNSWRHVKTSAKECQTCPSGTCQETTTRTCRNEVCYSSSTCSTGTQVQTTPSQDCWSCP